MTEIKKRINEQIDYLREVRNNLRKYIDENQDKTNDITIQINVGSCKGQVIEINRNIKFLKSLLTTYEHEKVKILDYIHSNL